MPSPLEGWADFHVIVGSSAGALTGLQFVVLTLVAQAESVEGGEDSIAAFGSPNVVHFCSALLVAALLSAPWHGLSAPALALAAVGLAGVFYGLTVWRRARVQSSYQPVLEDWIWHTILPNVAYAALLMAGATLARRPAGALFAAGGAELLLVFVGIHNAWDTVTYVTARERLARGRPPESAMPMAAAPPRTTPPLGPGGPDAPPPPAPRG